MLGASAICATMIFPLRAWRWQVILAPIDEHIGFGPLWRATAIGMMVNNVVPARVGELARAFALTREVPKISFSASFASLAVDRVFDAVIVMLLLLVSLADPALPSGNTEVSQRLSSTLALGLVVAIVFLVMLYLLVFLPSTIIRWYEALSRRIAPKLEAKGREVLLAFAAGLGVLRSPRRFAVVFLWTLAHWLVNALAFWIGFKAVGIDISFSAALLVQGVIVVGVAIPQAPGFFGVFEAAARWTLVQVYGVSATLAVSWAIGFHLLSFIPITVIGAFYFAKLGMRFGELRSPAGVEAPERAAL
jgi:uncharacterized protein (TIRG00374 family)